MKQLVRFTVHGERLASLFTMLKKPGLASHISAHGNGFAIATPFSFKGGLSFAFRCIKPKSLVRPNLYFFPKLSVLGIEFVL